MASSFHLFRQRSLCQFALLLSFCLRPGLALAQREVGNGGDLVRSSFISFGSRIVSFLIIDERGRLIGDQSALGVTSLMQTLTVDRIRVIETDDPTLFRDNSGTPLDARTINGIIYLKQDAWLRHFERPFEPFQLIFHEMLLSAGYDDRDAVISRKISGYEMEIKYIEERRLLPRDHITSDDQPWEDIATCEGGRFRLQWFVTSGPYAARYYRVISDDERLIENLVRRGGLVDYFIDGKRRFNSGLSEGSYRYVTGPHESTLLLELRPVEPASYAVSVAQVFRALDGGEAVRPLAAVEVAGCRKAE